MKIVPIRYLIDSKECLLLKNLAELDTDHCKDDNYFKKNIFDKLFRKMKEDDSDSFYLKNKYLYYLSGGTIAYIEAMCSMKEAVSNCEKIETEKVVNIIKENIKDYHRYDFVSLGCGDGKKDFKIISELNNNHKQTYIPIDVSPQMLLLTINYFIDNGISENISIDAINCDFFDFSAALKIGNDKPKIYTCLGGTIGNYYENALLDKFSQIMQPNDYLIVSFDLYNRSDGFSNHIKKYLTHSNLEFLINPLKLIPKFKGYLENRTKYFNFYPDIDKYKPRDDISNIPDGLSFAPTITIPYEGKRDVHVAWTTKYYKDSVSVFFKDSLQFIFVDGKEKEDKYIVLLEKKKETTERKTVLNKLKDWHQTTPNETALIEQMMKYVEKTPSPSEIFIKKVIESIRFNDEIKKIFLSLEK
jgi:hypothetical protein